jgi:hypothetical protein
MSEPSIEPVRIMGPSRPSEPPEPTVTIPAASRTSAGRGSTRPPLRAIASMIPDMPWPRTSWRKTRMMRATAIPPARGATTFRQGCATAAYRAAWRRVPSPQQTLWTQSIVQ